MDAPCAIEDYAADLEISLDQLNLTDPGAKHKSYLADHYPAALPEAPDPPRPVESNHRPRRRSSMQQMESWSRAHTAPNENCSQEEALRRICKYFSLDEAMGLPEVEAHLLTMPGILEDLMMGTKVVVGKENENEKEEKAEVLRDILRVEWQDTELNKTLTEYHGLLQGPALRG